MLFFSLARPQKKLAQNYYRHERASGDSMANEDSYNVVGLLQSPQLFS